MDNYVKRSLQSILILRIYKADIGLIRNDSKAAKLVVQYVSRVSSQVYEDRETEELSLERAKDIMFGIEPLVGLAEGTVRKYIAELWQDEFTLKSYMNLRDSDHIAFDNRQI